MNWFLIVCSIQILCACSVAAPANRVLAEINDADFTLTSRRPSVIELEQGKPGVLYVNKEGRVALKIEDETKLLDATARVKMGASYPKLYRYGPGLQALWWSHADGKNIYMTSSVDGGKHFTPVGMPNADNGVLLPFALLPGTNAGVLGLVYSDERNPGYQVYANRSVDGGSTWSKVDTRLDTPPAGGRSSSAQEPIALILSNAWIVVWSDTHHEDGRAVYRLLSTVSKNDGLSWSSPKVIHVADRFISSLVGSVEGDTAVVAADVLGRGVFASVSLDAGSEWKTVGIVSGTENAENSGLRVLQKNGYANYTWMQKVGDKKPRIMHARLDVKAVSWLDEGAKRLDDKVHDNTKSMSPEIVALEGGRLVAAWSDYREIVPNIYISISDDDGKNWKPNVPLMNLAKEWPAGWPQILPWGNGIAIAQAERDAFKFGNERFAVRQVGFEALNATGRESTVGAPELIGEGKVERLRQRVDELWRARIESNLDKSYSTFDHAYRALNTKEAYRDSQGPIKYLSYFLGDVSVKGNEAKVHVTTKYEIKPTLLPMMSKPLEVPPTDATAETTWVWVVNDWYQVYSSAVLKEQPLDY